MKSKPLDVRWVTGNAADVDVEILKDLLCLEIFNFGQGVVQCDGSRVVFDIAGLPCNHWSRAEEIPWAIKVLDLQLPDCVLEMGGSGATLQYYAAGRVRRYTNVDRTEKYVRDAEASKLNALTCRRVTFHAKDFRDWAKVFTWETYDKVVSVSAVEHDDDPLGLLRVMWSKLKPRGRLVLTMDVAEYPGPEHWIDPPMLMKISDEFGFDVPQASTFAQATVPEADGNGTVQLRVLCVCLEKME